MANSRKQIPLKKLGNVFVNGKQSCQYLLGISIALRQQRKKTAPNEEDVSKWNFKYNQVSISQRWDVHRVNLNK